LLIGLWFDCMYIKIELMLTHIASCVTVFDCVNMKEKL